MPPSRPQIRAFLSSTFSDFLEERSLLVKQVFPALRRKAKDRGVEVVEVDLRWGITEEQSKQGQTIGICLDEIERCRPYFIGLLGDRYGWVPEKDDYRPELLRRQDWLPEHQGNASVTELEILHGVLNNPEMAGRTFFYFRDPAYSDAKAAEDPGWHSKTPEERQKLEALKQRIRDSGFPVVEDLATPEAIAEQIEADLWSLIEEQYPEAVKTDAPALETARHASYRADRTGLYLGGEVYITQLQDWISTGEQRILITGESGAGKSALIANWVAAHESSQPDDVIFCHHLGSSNDASALRPLLARMIDNASRLLAEELSEPLKVPQDWWELVTQVTTTLYRLSTWAIRHQRRWIWVLDGLDKLDLDDQQAMPWLPLVLPKGVYLVASALDCPIRSLLQERIYATLTIGPLGEAEREQLIQKYLSLYTKELVPALRQKITSHRQGSSPLFLRVLLEELRLCGEFETLAEQLQGYLAAKTVADLYELVLQRLEEDGHGDTVRKVMTALWASRAGLSENELLAITGLVHAQWALIGIGLQETLGEANGRLVFGHDFLRQAVRKRYLSTEEQCRQAHIELADWFGDNDEWSKRKAEEWPWQLQQAGCIGDLRDLLLDVNLLSCLVDDVGTRVVLGYWEDVRPSDGGELDELIAEDVEEEILKLKDESGKIIYLSDQLSELFEEGGLHRNLLLRLRALSLELEKSSRNNDEEAVLSALRAAGDANRLLGRYEEAEGMYRQCLEAYEVLLGAEHLSTMIMLANLATLYDSMGKYKQAVALCERAHNAFVIILGPDHPDTLASLSNLAECHERNHNYKKAEDLHLRCVKSKERVLGMNDPRTVDSMLKLAKISTINEEFQRAERLYLDCLNLSEHCLGRNHPVILSAVSGLAGVYMLTCDYERAEALFNRVLDARTILFGSDHIVVSNALFNLAELHEHKGESEKAVIHYTRVLNIRGRQLGSTHPETLFAIVNLAEVYRTLQDYEKARELYERFFEQCAKFLGNNHPYTLATTASFAEMCVELGDTLHAEELFKSCLERQTRLLGRDHVDTLSTVERLADLHKENGDYAQAEIFYQWCLQIQEEFLDQDHNRTYSVFTGLADVLKENGDFAQAEALYKRSLEGLIDQLGRDHSETISVVSSMALLYLHAGNNEQAEGFLKETIEASERTFGLNSKSASNSRILLAKLMTDLNRRNEAVLLLEAEAEVTGKDDEGRLGDVIQYLIALVFEMHDNECLKEAESHFSILLSLCHAKLAAGDFQIGRVLAGLSKTLEQAGKLDEALDYAQQCLNHRLEYEGPDSFYTNRNRFDVVPLLHKLERDSEALLLLNQLDASLTTKSELSDDEQQLLADASALRATIEGEPE